MIAVLAAVGPGGIDRTQLASELWNGNPPTSWRSAIRNRISAARRTLGPKGIISTRDHLRLGDDVTVDSWELLAHTTSALGSNENELAFLDNQPFADVTKSPLILAHVRQIHEARAALTHQIIDTGRELTPPALRSLRTYQQEHRHNLIDNQHRTKTKIAFGSELHAGIQRGTAERAALFERARANEDWSLAFEIAMAGLPEAERIEGDPDRLALLGAIPLEGLPAALRFSLALALARHSMYAGRDAEALAWTKTTRELASSPNEELLTYITGALVGDTDDERAPIPLPPSFQTAPLQSLSMQSLQVAVMNHLERGSHQQVAPLKERFMVLVDACAEPYRRWHLLLLQAMMHLVDGKITEAQQAARLAFDYAHLFSITDAKIALVGQLSNAWVAHPGFAGIGNFRAEYPATAETAMCRALSAVRHCREGNRDAVDQFLRSYNYQSTMFFTFPIVTMVAPYITDPTIRSEVSERLHGRTGTSAIWGTGVLHLGPVDRTLALVTANPGEARSHLDAAITIADEQQTLLWQVICRLDLWQAGAKAEYRDQARALATTPELRQIVDEYQSALISTS